MLVAIRCLFHLLPFTHFDESFWIRNVGNCSWVLIAKHARSFFPALGLYAETLTEKCHEDLGLLFAIARQCTKSLKHNRSIIGVVPDVLGLVLILRGNDAADGVNALCHCFREPMNRRLVEAQRQELIGVHRCNLLRVKMTEAILQCVCTVECPLHRHLLIKQHADE